MKPHATVKVRFLTESEGGRKRPISANSFGCPMLVDDRGFDCRFVLNKAQTFELGSTYLIDVQFLSPSEAMNALMVGKQIKFWEGKVIAEGEVVELSN